MNQNLRTFLRALLALGVLGAGIGVFVALRNSRPVPQKKPTAEVRALVDVESARLIDHRATISAQGSVIPARQVVLIPEVTGRVRWQNERLVPGGRVKKGEPLVRIDGRVYSLQASQAQAQLEQAELMLQLEASRKSVAENEWKIIGDPKATDAGKAVALREPQLKSAESAVKAAQSGHAMARVYLGRTVMSAPFNAFVQREMVELGQVVGPQSQLATLVGTDTYWVQTSLSVDALPSLSIPGVNCGEGEGSSARVVQVVAGSRIVREGKVLRLLGDLDPVGRMARVLVEVKNPLMSPAGKPAAGGEGETVPSLPLLIGSYVLVELDGAELQGVVKIPRRALRDDGKVFVHNKEARLSIQKVSVVWRQRDWLLVRGLEEGALVVTSRVPGAVRGLALTRSEPAVGAPAPEPDTPVEPEGESPKKVLGQR